MITDSPAATKPATTEEKYAEAKRRLLGELQKIADEVTFLNPQRPEWKPLLDSRSVVSTVFVLEELFPRLKVPPDQLVQKGGYNDGEVAADDIIRRHKECSAGKAKANLKQVSA